MVIGGFNMNNAKGRVATEQVFNCFSKKATPYLKNYAPRACIVYNKNPLFRPIQLSESRRGFQISHMVYRKVHEVIQDVYL